MSNLSIARSSFALKVAVVVFVFADLVIYYTSRGSFAGLKPRFYLITLFAVFVACRMVMKAGSEKNIYKSSGITLGLFLMFVLNALAVNLLMQSTADFQYYILVYMQPLLIVLILPSLVEGNPKLLMIAVIIMGTLSGVIGILQGLNIETAWDLRTLVSEHLKRGIRLNNRAPGLLSISVRQSQLLLLSFAAVLAYGVAAQKNKRLWSILLVIHLIAIVFSGTRSAILAVAAMIAVTFWMKFPSQRRLQVGIVLLCGALGAAVFPLIENFSSSRLVSVSDASAQVRVLFLNIGANLIVENPLGYGARSFAIVTGNTDLTLATFENDGAVGKVGDIESHNYFINILFYYGVQGSILLTAIYAYFMSRAARLMRQQSPHAQQIGLAAVLAVVGQFVDGFFHNSGLLNGYTGLAFFWVAVEAQHRFNARHL